MKIYFCDKCNASIPLKAIEENRISIDQGKIYCDNCAPRRPSGRPRRANLATAAVALLFGAGLGMLGMAVWGDRIFGARRGESLPDRVERIEKGLDDFKKAVSERQRLADLDLEESPAVDGRAGKLARVNQAIQANADAIQSVRQAFNALSDQTKSGLQAQSAAIEAEKVELDKRAERLETRIDVGKINSDLDHLRGAIDTLDESMSLLRDKVDLLERRSEGPRTATPVAPPVTDEKLDPETEKKLIATLAQYESKEAPKRFSAVVDLSTIKCRRSEEAIVRALDDSAEYVRSAALQGLMDNTVKWSIPHVIAKLKDENFFVREGAIATLEKLIGRSIEIQANDPPSKIQAKIRELETWWASNKDKLGA